MQKKYNRFKNFKIKIIQNEKRNKMEEERKEGIKKKGKLHRTAKAQRRGRSL